MFVNEYVTVCDITLVCMHTLTCRTHTRTYEQIEASEGAAMRKIIRSKGFVWIANQHRYARTGVCNT
jgi:hypothetical protein